jgi:hypothetical protein
MLDALATAACESEGGSFRLKVSNRCAWYTHLASCSAQQLRGMSASARAYAMAEGQSMTFTRTGLSTSVLESDASPSSALNLLGRR